MFLFCASRPASKASFRASTMTPMSSECRRTFLPRASKLAVTASAVEPFIADPRFVATDSVKSATESSSVLIAPRTSLVASLALGSHCPIPRSLSALGVATTPPFVLAGLRPADVGLAVAVVRIDVGIR